MNRKEIQYLSYDDWSRWMASFFFWLSESVWRVTMKYLNRSILKNCEIGWLLETAFSTKNDQSFENVKVYVRIRLIKIARNVLKLFPGMVNYRFPWLCNLIIIDHCIQDVTYTMTHFIYIRNSVVCFSSETY